MKDDGNWQSPVMKLIPVGRHHIVSLLLRGRMHIIDLTDMMDCSIKSPALFGIERANAAVAHQCHFSIVRCIDVFPHMCPSMKNMDDGMKNASVERNK